MLFVGEIKAASDADYQATRIKLDLIVIMSNLLPVFHTGYWRRICLPVSSPSIIGQSPFSCRNSAP